MQNRDGHGCAIGACQMGFPAIKNHGKVQTPFVGLDASPYRDWKDSRPRPRLIFSQKATMGTYGTRIIDRNHVNQIDNNLVKMKLE